MRKLTSQDFSIVYWRKNCAIINFLCYFAALFAVVVVVVVVCTSYCLLLASFLPLSPGTSGRGPHCQTLSTLLRIISLPPSLVRVFLLCLWQQHFLIFCNICRVFFSTFFPALPAAFLAEQRRQQVSHEVDQKRQANVANSCAVVGISLVPLFSGRLHYSAM